MVVATTQMLASRSACPHQVECSPAPAPVGLSLVPTIAPVPHITLSLLFPRCLQLEALAWSYQITQRPWCQWLAKVRALLIKSSLLPAGASSNVVYKLQLNRIFWRRGAVKLRAEPSPVLWIVVENLMGPEFAGS